ncbi:MAG: winged helix-turn-helix domain-containing protein [Acidobacteriota bacterium]|jgi:Tol biopolymer transport system component/DNA-binding winged helix-turn-helix (wHTH) protein
MEESFRLDGGAGGSWVVQPSLHRVQRVGGVAEGFEPVQVEPKVLRVLVELAREPGRVISQDELRERVWGTAHVSDEVVRRAVYELRKILGEDAGEPRFIETVPRAGYRLLAAVERVAAPRPAASATRRWLPAALLALFVAVPALGFLVFFELLVDRERAAGSAAAPAPRIRPLTSLPGLEYDPAFSPDGGRIAFVRADSDGLDPALHVQVVGEGAPLRLVEGGEQPCWAPDGRRILFVVRAEGTGGSERGWEIRSVPALGGPSRLVAEAGAQEPYGLACSPDGRHVAYGWAEHHGEAYRITLLDLETGERRFLSHPPAGISGDGEPAFSPDGGTIAFLRNHYGLIQDVYTVPLTVPGPDSGDAPAERRITRASRKIPDVVWSPDGAHLLFTRYGGGDHRLWRISVDGGAEAEPVPVGEGAMTLSLDRAGGRLAYTRYLWKFRFWRVELPSGAAEPLPLLSSTRFDSEVAVAPDGERLAFVSTRSGDFELWVSGIDAASPRRLTDFGGPTVREPAWSPDGRWIAFTAAVDGDADIWRIDPRGGLPERVTAAPGHEVAPWWSRDGRWLYYASNRAAHGSARWELWRRPADGEAGARSEKAEQADQPVDQQVTRGGGHRGAESLDGRWLYFSRRGQDGLWRRPLGAAGSTGAGQAELVLPELRREHEGNWAVGPDGIVFVTKDETPGSEQGSVPASVLARFVPASGDAPGRVETVTRLESWPISPSLALAPDGSWLIYSQAHGVESDIVLAENVF